MTKQLKSIPTDPRDWGEIWYALDSRLEWVKSTGPDPGDTGEHAEWIAHLESILSRMGADGEDAYLEVETLGVNP